MSYEKAVEELLKEEGVELSTMMGTACLRYGKEFLGMMFDKEDALIIKVSPERVLELMDAGQGREFNYTGKRFKEWVLIGSDHEGDYPLYLREALAYAKSRKKK